MGWKLRQRLNEEGLKVCSDLWQLSVTRMQKGLGLGEKTGRALWEACRGIDKRPVQVSQGVVLGRPFSSLEPLRSEGLKVVEPGL